MARAGCDEEAFSKRVLTRRDWDMVTCETVVQRPDALLIGCQQGRYLVASDRSAKIFVGS